MRELSNYVLTENILKKIVLRFLRSYYKSRKRADAKPSEALINLASREGVMADGLIRIPLHDEEGEFLVTFEATSFHKIEEIRYRKLAAKLGWDGFALSNLSLSVIFSLSYIYKWHPIQVLGLFNVLVIYLLAAGLFMLLYWQVLAPLARYRYIFALEQFKQYFANEQWIAVAHDAVEALPEGYYDELRRQCVNQGVGLLIVHADLSVRPVITPSREITEKKRKRNRLEFNPIEKLPIRKIPKFKWGRAARLAKTMQSLVKNENINYKRFQRRFYYKQWLLSLIALLFTGYLLYQDYSDLPLVYVDEDKYRQQMEEEALSAFPEVVDFYVDTPAVTPFRPDEKAYLDIREEAGENRKLPLQRQSRDEADVFFLTGEGEPLYYDCSRIKNLPSGTFGVLISQVNQREEAIQWMYRLEGAGLSLGFFRNSCFNPKGKESFSVIVGAFFETRREAGKRLEDVKKELKRRRLPLSGMKIVRFL